MTDQNSQFMAILTAVGEAKQANANALGIPWVITQMGVGDANGTDPAPDRLQTSLINERRRAPLNRLDIDPNNDAIIIAEQVIPENVGGWWIREIGLYDEDNDLVAVANCPPTFKPELSQGSGRTQVVRLNILVSSTQNIQLKIDPSVVLATRAWVESLAQTSASDKTAGRRLKVGAFGLGGLALVPTNNDLNQISVGGFYITTASIANQPPGRTLGTVHHIERGSNNAASQVWVGYGSSSSPNEIWIRYKNSNVWSQWQECWHRGNLVKQADANDTTSGALMAVGAFGLGANLPLEPGDNYKNSRFKAWQSNAQDVPGPGVTFCGFDIGYAVNRRFQLAISAQNDLWFRYTEDASGTTGWRKTWHSGNLVKQASATDATVGAVLLTGAFGLGGNASTLTNIDTVNKTGFYLVTAATEGTKPGDATIGTLVHIERGSSSQVTQFFDRLLASGAQQLWIRTKYSGGAWSGWQELLHGGNAAALPIPTALAASSDNNRTCGTASLRWSTVYAGTGTINTSDSREKTSLRTLNTAEIEAAKQLAKEIGTYRFLAAIQEKGDEAREHIGMTVQRAIEVMQLNGLDPFNYGFICYDAWPEEWREVAAITELSESGELDENGGPVMEEVEIEPARNELVRAAGDRYSFRPDELLLFIAAGLDARIEALETSQQN